ncbi:ATP-grasp domain-containing protein [Salipaludibacillus sp. HK11]|uniref:ATP-grasp domain-containing protein n=1 Tax=Salipaludibacillus sp. HK11 TaxID=3394320 RepID=UPI0039FDCE86
MNKRTGWIIYNGHLKTTKFIDYVQWFKKTAEQFHIEMFIKSNDQLLVSTDPSAPIFDVEDNRHVTLPDFVHFADKDLHLARQLDRLGVPLFNSAESIAICDNKSLMHEHLMQHHIQTPKTIIAPMIYPGIKLTNLHYLDAIESEIGLPLIMKEAYGSFGQQVYWIDSTSKLAEKAKELAGIPHLYQQPVFTSIGVDIRLNVVGDQVVAAMKRTSWDDFRANVTAGGTTKSYQPSKQEIELALAATKAVGADFTGVDLLIGENGPLVCEVNSNPHIRSIYECTGIDVAISMIHHIIQQVPTTSDRRSR